MNRFISNNKCLVFCFLLSAFGASAVFGDNEDKATKREDKVAAPYRSVVAAENRRALEAYEKRNAEIAPWSKDALAANTDNAALLYYQACLFVREPNEALEYKIRPNVWPTTQIRTYLGHCLPVIELLETASRIPDCNWAVWHRTGSGWAPLPKLRLLANILLLDATTLAVDGRYRVALERCLTVRRISRHLGDDPGLFYEEYFDAQALSTIKTLLGMLPADAEILTWFRDELAEVPGPSPTFAKTWRAVKKTDLRAMRTDPDSLRFLRALALRQAKGQQAKENIQKLTDEEIRSRVSRAAEAIAQSTDSILEIISSKADYNKKLSYVREFYSQLMADEGTDPIAKVCMGLPEMNSGHVEMLYNDQVEQEACLSGTKAAVEIYLVLAKTGKLPEELPDHLPKDPFTSKDFGYEITDEGFALRCEGEDFKKRKRSLLEFIVRR